MPPDEKSGRNDGIFITSLGQSKANTIREADFK